MHILHIIDSLERGGSERMLVDIANTTVADGKNVSVCVTRQQTALAADLDPKIKLWILGRTRRLDWLALRRLARIVREQNVTIIHAHGRSTFALLVFARSLQLLHCPVVFHDHYGPIELDVSVPLWLRLWGKYFVDRYVGVSPKLGDWARIAGIPVDRIHVIDNALDFHRFEDSKPLDLRREFNLKNNGPIGITVAALRPAKAIEVLLEAVAQVAPPQDFQILVVGGTRDLRYASACRERRRELKLEQRVIFAGERADVPSIIKGADFAVLPSRTESGPLVLIEFLFAGLPFVATKVGSISQRVARLGITEFVEPNDPSMLGNALATLLRLSVNERQARGQGGKRIAEQYFDIRRTIPQWYEVYQAAAAERT